VCGAFVFNAQEGGTMNAVWPNGLKTRPNFTTLWQGYPGHNGLDCINFDVNHAVMGGRVVAAGWQFAGGGYVVEVLADNRDYHRYLHNRRGLFVKAGQRVITGQPLGWQGTTGKSTGKHLHFAVRKGGRWGYYINPLPYLIALVGASPAGGNPTPFPTQQDTEDDDMKPIYRHANNPKTGLLEYGIFGITIKGGWRASTHEPTGQAWGKLFGKPNGDSWGLVPWDQWQTMQAEAKSLHEDWAAAVGVKG
jgi:hypothetical protein